MKIPFVDLVAQHRRLKAELLEQWGALLDSASFVGGEMIRSFEERFARYCDTEHCVSVGSGTDALRFIFLALGSKPGDEIITVPNTFIATSEAISQAGATPVFVDVDPDTYTLDPRKIEERISRRTIGIVPVHLYGQVADMDPICEIADRRGLWVAEDACQAHGALYKGKKAGNLARAAAFSFYPGKNLGACGEAGAITTNDAAVARKVSMLRDHGQAAKYIHDCEGYNGRCDALQAATLLVKLSRLDEWNELRRSHAHYYMQRLHRNRRITLPFAKEQSSHVYHLFVVMVENRDAVARQLSENGIGTGLHYPVALHLQHAYRDRRLTEGSFPIAEHAARHCLSLPMFPELTHEQMDFVCDCLGRAVGRHGN